jgi:hypothetical protein
MLTTTEVSFDCIVKLVRRGRDRIIDEFTSTYVISLGAVVVVIVW